MVSRKRGNGYISNPLAPSVGRFSITYNGRRIREKTGFKHKQQAEQLLRQKLVARDNGDVPSVLRKVKECKNCMKG